MHVRKSGPSPKEAFMRVLRQDHARLSRVFREIDVQQALLSSNAEQARLVLLEAMDYLLTYQDGFHHAREDHLFERIATRLPQCEKDMRTLMREHASGLRHDKAIAQDLANSSARSLQGPRGRLLARRLREHMAHARAHIRREEEVFYARAEKGLASADWAALMRLTSMDDPLSQPEQLRKTYPLLAQSLESPVTEVTGPGDRPPAADAPRSRWRAAARESLEQAVEASGNWTMDAIELARANARSLRQARTPLELLSAGHTVTMRNGRFAMRCVWGPQRWMADMLAQSWRQSREPNRAAKER